MKKLDIIYEDKEIIVINKEAGLLTIATEKEKNNTLYHKVLEYEQKKNKRNRIYIVHRLDKDTSGIVLFAKNKTIKEELQNNWDKLVKLRHYIAIVEGKVIKKEDTIKSYITENKNYISYTTNKYKGKLAITKYKIKEEVNKYTILDIEILTGRKNQIRLHMKEMGNPIIGDKKYGSKNNPIKRLGLHADKLIIYHPIVKKQMIFEAKIPKEFDKIIKK